MIAEIAAASAAYATIKTAIQQGKELYDVAKEIGTFLDSKESLQKKAHANGHKSDLQAFLELEKINDMQRQLKEAMVYSGRGGLWPDYCAFMSDRKKQREAEKIQAIRKKQRRKKKIKEALLIALVTISVLSAVGIFFWLLWLYKNRGLV